MAVTATSTKNASIAPASAWDGSMAYSGDPAVPLTLWAVRLGLLIALLACLDLLGWIFHLRVLTSVFPGYATMKPNTAIGLGLVAAACLLRYRGEDPLRLWKSLAGDAAALAGFVLAGMTTFEVLTGRNFGIDTAFLQVTADRYGDPAGAHVAGHGRVHHLLGACFAAAGPASEAERWARNRGYRHLAFGDYWLCVWRRPAVWACLRCVRSLCTRPWAFLRCSLPRLRCGRSANQYVR